MENSTYSLLAMRDDFMGSWEFDTFNEMKTYYVILSCVFHPDINKKILLKNISVIKKSLDEHGLYSDDDFRIIKKGKDDGIRQV